MLVALTVIEKINSTLTGQISFDIPLDTIFCNALIEPHFDSTCSAWYPDLMKELRDKQQVTQNKCIKFCSGLNFKEYAMVETMWKLCSN